MSTDKSYDWNLLGWRVCNIILPLFFFPTNLLRFIMTTAAPDFNLADFTLSGDAEKGKWFMALDGRMELLVASATTRAYKKGAINTMRRVQKGKDIDKLPPEVLLDTTEGLLAKNALKGWRALVSAEWAASANLEGDTTYFSTGEPTPSGKVLVDVVPYGDKLLSYTPENAKLLITAVPDINDAVAECSNDRAAYRVGGADLLD